MKKTLSKKYLVQYIIIAVILAVCAVLFAVSRRSAAFADGYRNKVFSKLQAFFGRISGVLPFSLGELMIMIAVLGDNLITSKAMLIEKSQNKEELYQNIEDIISCKNKMEDFEYAQLEKIVKYELMGTEDKEIISKFIEKIKNREESENIMMNAARIINREIRKQRREGREEGMIFVAKKLKGKMHIKDISQITGLSEKEIEKL